MLADVPAHLKIFDMKYSGVGLTWKYFHDNDILSKNSLHGSDPLPEFLRYIQDRDLWTFTLSNTEPFTTYFDRVERNFNIWKTYLDSKYSKVVDRAITIGKFWLEHKNILMKELVRGHRVIHEIDGIYRIVLYCNSPILKSELGSYAFTAYPECDFSAIWHYNMEHNVSHFSLRSTADRVNVSVIAEKMGGGGHPAASGIQLEGACPQLPVKTYPNTSLSSEDVVTDHKLIEAIHDGMKAMDGTLRVECFETAWLQPKFIALLKRKFPTYDRLTFKTLAGDVYDVGINIA
jgi:hypothetical protein